MSPVAAWLLLAAACAGPRPTTPASSESLSVLQRRLVAKPADAEAHLRLGLYWARSGDGLRAQQYLQRAWALGADARRVLPPLVRVSLALSTWETALLSAQALADALRPGCDRDPRGRSCVDLAEVLVTLAALHESLLHPRRAVELLLQASVVNPRLAEAYLESARLLAEDLGDPAAARAVLRRGLLTLQLDPASARLARRLDDLRESDP